jgi:hypothetical protein
VSDKEFANVRENSFAVGDLGKGDFSLVKLAGERIISHYIAETVNHFHGYEYEIWHYNCGGNQ